MESSVGREHQKNTNDTGDWPISRQPEWANHITIIAKQEPPEADSHQQGNRDPSEGDEDRSIARQSAKASERQADYAEFGLWVGAVAALATAWAAWAAASAATAAAASNEIARETSKRELRAYVFAERVVIENCLFGFKATIAIRNSGQTPAYKCDQFAALDMCYIPRVIGFSEVKQDSGRMSCIAPGSNIGVILDSGAITDVQMRAIKDGRAAIWVYGTIWYDDAFGEPRYTKYRFIYNGKEFDSGASGVMMSDREGNEAT